ncbi:S24/S26 family peptidase [Arenimonas sp.]|uniref:S24/S26 family peptidase n=1 Tax=Arenimonas sp. TaxID=1872635 RepID=UPI0039E694D4
MSLPPAPSPAGGIALAQDVLSEFGQLRLRVTGNSMLPAVLPGDVLFFKTCPAESLAPGSVVLVRRDGRLFAHRLLALTPEGLLTQGDSMPQPDPPTPTADFLGVMIGQQRIGRDIDPHASPRFGRWLMRHSALARRIFLRWHRSTITAPA